MYYVTAGVFDTCSPHMELSTEYARLGQGVVALWSVHMYVWICRTREFSSRGQYGTKHIFTSRC